jgi:hypothetical protein
VFRDRLIGLPRERRAVDRSHVFVQVFLIAGLSSANFAFKLVQAIATGEDTALQFVIA